MSRGRIALLVVFALLGVFTMIVLTHANSPAARQRGCDRGELNDCANLALRYEHGADVPRDDARAFALYTRACDGGLAWACGALGAFYQQGRTVPVDDARAAELFQRGCGNGIDTGCYGLGQSYRDGRGVALDPRRALPLFRTACAANTPHSRGTRPSGHEQGCDEARALEAQLGEPGR